MSTEDQILPLSFQKGLDTKTAEKQTAPGNLLDLQNMIFTNPNSLTKRWGNDQLPNSISNGGNITTGVAINAFQDELLAYDGDKAYSFSINEQDWITKGTLKSVIVANQTITRNNTTQTIPDSASLNNITVTSWKDTQGGNTLRYSIFDNTTKAYIVQSGLVSSDASATGPKCIAFAPSNAVCIGYWTGTDKASSVLHLGIIHTNSIFTAPVDVVIASGVAYKPASHNAIFLQDFAARSDGYLFYSFYGGTGSGGYHNNATHWGLIDAAYIATNGVTGTQADLEVGSSTLADAAQSQFCAPSIAFDHNNNIWITYYDGNASVFSYQWQMVNPSNFNPLLGPLTITSSISPKATLLSSIERNSSGTIIMDYYWEVSNANTWQHFVQTNSYTVGTGVGSITTPFKGVGLASKAFKVNNSNYINLVYQNTLASSYFTIWLSNNQVVAQILANLASGLITSGIAPECSAITSNVFQFANGILGNIFSQNGQLSAFQGVNLTTLDFSHSNQFLSSAINSGLYTVGGILQSYDGVQYVEHGFHYYPESIVITPNATGSHNYQYAVCYAWLDNNGFTQWSTPSVVQSTTTSSAIGSGGSVSLVVPMLRLTKKTNVQIVVFRTTDTGSLFYQVSSPTSPSFNDPTTDTITITDTMSDATLQSNALMYTQPNTTGANPVVPNSVPPSCSLITTYSDRLFIGGLDNPNQLWYTKTRTNNVPMEFSNQFILNIDPKGGPITAIQNLDDKLIIFKNNAIFYISGQGPTATGDQNDFQNAIPIASPVGCTQPNSLVEIPDGLLFKSDKGIWLLSRSETVSYIGAPVEKFNNLVISSATSISPQYVLFTSTSGTALMYDYQMHEWSTFTNHPAIDSDIFLGNSNLLVWLGTDGYVRQQNLTSYLDGNSTQYPISITTAWLSLNNFQGYQRVKKIFVEGSYYGNVNETLTVNIGYDFNDTFTTTSSINLSTLTGNTPGPFQFRVDLSHQKCQSLRIQIIDNQTGTTPIVNNFSIDAITLKVGMKKGGQKLPAAKQFGST